MVVTWEEKATAQKLSAFHDDVAAALVDAHCKPKTPLHFPYTSERTECKVGIQEI